jgi:hypothetical protein
MGPDVTIKDKSLAKADLDSYVYVYGLSPMRSPTIALEPLSHMDV